MKKIIALAVAALCAVTFAVPAATTPAAAQSLSFGWGVNVGPGWWDGPRRMDRWDRPWRARRSGVSIDIGPVDIDIRARGGWRGHVARCEDRFISYDRDTDMYKGFDGDYHRCRL